MANQFFYFRTIAMSENYFFIRQEFSMRVLDASIKDPGEVHMWELHGGDNQLWYWQGDALKNKAYPEKVNQSILSKNISIKINFVCRCLTFIGTNTIMKNGGRYILETTMVDWIKGFDITGMNFLSKETPKLKKSTTWYLMCMAIRTKMVPRLEFSKSMVEITKNGK